MKIASRRTGAIQETFPRTMKNSNNIFTSAFENNKTSPVDTRINIVHNTPDIIRYFGSLPPCFHNKLGGKFRKVAREKREPSEMRFSVSAAISRKNPAK